MRKFKKWLALFWCDYPRVRKFVGGRWATSRKKIDWVQFNDLDDEIAWDGLRDEEYIKEEYR